MVCKLSRDGKVEDGSLILLLTEKGKKYLIKVRRGQRFHTSEGFIVFDEVIGKEYGSVVKSNVGSTLFILRPTILDIAMKFKRVTQVVYPKELGLIIIMGDIRPGKHVLEAGTGTGVLTAILATHVMPYGKVYSYDVEHRYIENAKSNIDGLGLSNYVEFKVGDVTKSIEERDLDATILDIPTPWLAVRNCYKALKGSGMFVSLSPTMEQVIETVETLRAEGFVDVKTVEILVRTIRVKRGMTRPDHLMRAHTAYLVFARKGS